MLSSLWPPAVLGGAELYASRLASELRTLGHEVGVVTLGVGGPDVVAQVRPWPYALQDFADQPAWKRALFHARDVYDPTAGAAVRRAIRRFAPDVVHSHSVAGMSAAALSAPSAAGVAHVHTLHDYWLLCERTTLMAADGSVCEQRCRGCVAVSAAREHVLRRHFADVVITPSAAVAAEHAAWQWLAARVEVVRHPGEGWSVPAPRPEDRTLTFGFLGQVTAPKGVRTLLAAFSGLPAGSAALRVAGRGQLDREVAAAARSNSAITQLGWVDGEAREAFFAGVDCLVVPSEWKEAAGLVAIEANDHGLPVVAARIGGLPEYVDPASEPLLFRPGDPSDLTRALRQFLAEPGAFRPAGPVTSTWPAHAAAIVGVYERAT